MTAEMSTTTLRASHLDTRRPANLCRSPLQWARALEPGGLRYRLYMPAGDGVLEVRRPLFATDAPRARIAAGLVAVRAEMREARGVLPVRPSKPAAVTPPPPAGVELPRPPLPPPPPAAPPVVASPAAAPPPVHGRDAGMQLALL